MHGVWKGNNYMSLTVILSVCLFSMSVAYLTSVYNFNKLRSRHQKLFIEMMVLEKIVNESEELKIQSDESVHKENFIKFLSDSRDWAYKYIEDVQSGLSNFIVTIEPEIKYFKEFGGVLGESAPNYYSMKKITEEYEKLKTLLPKEENTNYEK
jgi:biopolymer transport protein ExbB/TolQ